jgi:hypothetical protein
MTNDAAREGARFEPTPEEIEELERTGDFTKMASVGLRILARNSWNARGAQVERAFQLAQKGEATLGSELWGKVLAVIDATAALELAINDVSVTVRERQRLARDGQGAEVSHA